MTMTGISIETNRARLAPGALGSIAAADQKSLDRNPHYIEQLHALGIRAHQEGRTREGIALVLHALEADGGDSVRYNDLGNMLVENGDLDHAAIAFRAAVDLRAEDANLWNNLGSVLHRLNDCDAAETAYRNALYLNADFVAALNNLAALLAQTGRAEESSKLACRAFVLPPHEGKSKKMLGIAYYRLGRTADAAACYRAWLEAEPDNTVASYHLAACTGENVPERTPDEYVRKMFDGMAATFDEKLRDNLAYRGPEIVSDLLAGHCAANAALSVLDAGCGTGLCAPLLAPYAERLVGVDLSPAMLARAHERQLYDELVEAELTAFLGERPATFDLIAMADTLLYFGDLAPVLAALRGSLRRGGRFAFTVEAVLAPEAREIDFRLTPSGRYAHSRSYLMRTLEAAGFRIMRNDEVILRSEFCRPTHGFAILAGAAD